MKHLKSFIAVVVISLLALTAPVFAEVIKDVNVVNTPDVKIINTPSVKVDVPVRVPFQKTLTASEWNTQSINLILNVPSGERLVIEYISAFAFMGPNEEFSSLAVITNVEGQQGVHIFSLPETAPGFTGSNTYAGGQCVRIYADEGALISLTKVAVGGGISFGSASVTVSGYLIPVTSPTLAP